MDALGVLDQELVQLVLGEGGEAGDGAVGVQRPRLLGLLYEHGVDVQQDLDLPLELLLPGQRRCAAAVGRGGLVEVCVGVHVHVRVHVHRAHRAHRAYAGVHGHAACPVAAQCAGERQGAHRVCRAGPLLGQHRAAARCSVLGARGRKGRTARDTHVPSAPRP